MVERVLNFLQKHEFNSSILQFIVFHVSHIHIHIPFSFFG